MWQRGELVTFNEKCNPRFLLNEMSFGLQEQLAFVLKTLSGHYPGPNVEKTYSCWYIKQEELHSSRVHAYKLSCRGLIQLWKDCKLILPSSVTFGTRKSLILSVITKCPLSQDGAVLARIRFVRSLNQLVPYWDSSQTPMVKFEIIDFVLRFLLFTLTVIFELK